MALQIKDLPIGNYMTAFPISVLPDVSLSDAVSFMARRGIGSLIVSKEDGSPLGIFTERDVLKEIVSEETLANKLIKDVSYQPFEKITLDATVFDAANTMITKKAKLLVFADNDKLVGITTASDMLRAFRKTDVSPLLSGVVSTEIQQCSSSNSILDAAKIMHEKRVGSVIVSKKDGSKGIFTERDILFKVLYAKVPFKESVELFSSFPLITSKTGILANEAASVMAANNIKRLALTKDGEIVGVVTALDLVRAFQQASSHS